MASTVTAPSPRPPGHDGGARPAGVAGGEASSPAGPGWREDATLASTVALTGTTLAVALGFGRLFAGSGFLGPVILGTLAAHGVAWWCRRRRLSTGLAAVVTIGSVLLVAAWTVLGHATAYGVPIPHTLGEALEALAAAQGSFSVVKAPAQVLPGFVLATVLAVGISAFMADWAAFRLQATFEAVIPAFTLFVFTSALGTSRHRGWAVALFVVGVLAFILVNGLDRSSRSGAWFGGRPAAGPAAVVKSAALLGAVALVAGLAVGPRLPGAGDPPVVKYKNRVRPGPSSRATVSPLVDIRGRLVERAGVEVFTVSSPVKAYWRLTSLDTFDGVLWSSNDTYRPTRGGIGTDERLRADLPVAAAEQSFTIQNLASIWLPAAFRPQRVSGLPEVSYNRDTASLITPSESTDGLTYTVRSDVPQLRPEELTVAEAQVPRSISARYLPLPDVSERVTAEARRIVAGAPTPYERARALQDHFQRAFRYDLGARQGHDSQALENFLFRTRRGYCEQFAGAYAVLGRILGLPTRVAVGFTPGELRSDGRYHVRDEHAHAWPEVYLHTYGWVAFEPTPGRGAPGAESYTGLPEAQDASGNSTTATTASVTPTTVANDETPATAPRPAGAPDPAGPEEQGDGRPGVVLAGLALLAGGALWALVVPGLHLRRRRRRHAASGAGSAVLALWADVAEVLASAGVARRAAETMAEYAARAARAAGLQPDPARALEELASDAAAAAYAGGEVRPEVAEGAAGRAAVVQQAVLERVTAWERLRWWLDPRPLLRPAPGRT